MAQKPWGGPPSCDPAPLTTSLRGLWVSGNAGTGQWLLRTKGRRPKNRPSDTRGGDPKTDLRKEAISKQLGREGRGPKDPGVVAPLTFYKLSRQLLVGRNVHRWHRRRVVGLLSSFCFLVLMLSVILRQRPLRQSDDVKPSASSQDFLKDRPVHSRRTQYAGRLSRRSCRKCSTTGPEIDDASRVLFGWTTNWWVQSQIATWILAR